MTAAPVAPPAARAKTAPPAAGHLTARQVQQRRPRSAAAVTVAAMLLSAVAAFPLLRIFGPAGLRLLLPAVPAATLVTALTRIWLGRVARAPRSPLPVAAGFAAGLVAGALPGLLLAAPDPFGPAALGPRLHQAVT